MAKAKVKRFFIAASREKENIIISSLQKFGKLEISNPREIQAEIYPKEDFKETEEKIREYRNIINILSLQNEIVDTKLLLKPLDSLENAKNEILDIEAERAKIIIERQKLQQELNQLERWNKLEVSLEDLGDFAHGKSFIGSIPQITTHNLDSIKNFFYKIVDTSNKENRIWILCTNDTFKEANEILKSSGFTSVSLPVKKGFIMDHITSWKNKIEKIQSKENELASRLNRMSEKHASDFLAAYDYYWNYKKCREIFPFLQTTEKIFFIEGWIAEKNLKDLEAVVEDLQPVYISCREPLDDENPPTILDNNKVVEPFSYVTELFALPKKDEVDPSPFIMPFFATFFGVCLTDAGYGIVVSAFCIWLFIRYSIKGENKSLLGILLICGLSTVLIGTLVGGFFGIDIDNPKPALSFFANIAQKLRVMNPLDNLLLFFYITLGIGVIHIFTGKLINIYQVWKAEGFIQGIQVALPWLTFIPGFVLFLATFLFNIQGIPDIVMKTGNYLLISGLILIVLLADRGQKNIVARIGNGLFTLYGALSGTLSDILSYARLLALGIATGVVAMTVNIIAESIAQIPKIGIIFAVLIFIIGHTANILINALGAMIHSTRLQYVEFFNTFYEGGGKEFTLFKEERQYTYFAD
ncbi:MAG: V-type ATP synthase subunit I [Candidatus Coatesbacteria bacterium]|nr:V-type ATP synthase subunit I [Candidatus Coatesbacteria bacterium]